MSDELRAAANEIITAWESRPREYEPTTKFIAAKWLAEAYLADHPADECDQVTADWLESLGYSDSMNMRGTKRYEIVDGIRVMLFACEGPRCWRADLWVGAGKCYVTPDVKRRQVRQLLAALGIEVPK